MTSSLELRTGRLLLREWRDSDLASFAALNADPTVMEYMPALLSREESDAVATRIRDHFARHGFGLWALEVPGVTDFAGFVGLSIPAFQAHFTPCVEIGWRLARAHWGHGYATEAAREALRFGFERLGLEEIVSFTVPANLRSRQVMERLGMHRTPAEDFDHPRLPEPHPLRRHVLYRLSRSAWEHQARRSP
jgi:RimJ/RimL family protein N-acetyltransferase